MKRRNVLWVLGCAVGAWPLEVSAQQPTRVARVGWIDFVFEDDPDGRARLAVFEKGMHDVGWTLGRNLVIDYRWGVLDLEKARLAAAELLLAAPDLIVSAGTPAAMALREAASAIPVVFVSVTDPVAQGIVKSFAQPGGNLTGFSYLEPRMGAKWVELLKEIAPQINHVALMFNPRSAPFFPLYYQSIEPAAAKLEVEAVVAPVHEIKDIEPVITMLAARPGGGLIVIGDAFNLANRKVTIELAMKHRVPAIYGISRAAFDGGLVHYSVDIIYQYQLAVGYVDRILRGAAPADLPVQLPTKFSLVINLKAAKVLGLDIPPSLLARADEVIE
jgi:putative tryptophan/tyrosine transport system substrate-binding protein